MRHEDIVDRVEAHVYLMGFLLGLSVGAAVATLIGVLIYAIWG